MAYLPSLERNVEARVWLPAWLRRKRTPYGLVSLVGVKGKNSPSSISQLEVVKFSRHVTWYIWVTSFWRIPWWASPPPPATSHHAKLSRSHCVFFISSSRFLFCFAPQFSLLLRNQENKLSPQHTVLKEHRLGLPHVYLPAIPPWTLRGRSLFAPKVYTMHKIIQARHRVIARKLCINAFAFPGTNYYGMDYILIFSPRLRCLPPCDSQLTNICQDRLPTVEGKRASLGWTTNLKTGFCPYNYNTTIP